MPSSSKSNVGPGSGVYDQKAADKWNGLAAKRQDFDLEPVCSFATLSYAVRAHSGGQDLKN